LSGLSAAFYLLKYEGVEIKILERAPVLGGRANVTEHGDHCPRLFLNDYDYLFDILRQIPADRSRSIYDSLRPLKRYWKGRTADWVEISHPYAMMASELSFREKVKALRAKRRSPLIAEQGVGVNSNRYGSLRNYSIRSLARIAFSLARFKAIFALEGRSDECLVLPWVNHLRSNGVVVQPDSGVDLIRRGSDGVTVVSGGIGEQFDAVIVTSFVPDTIALLERSRLAHKLKTLRHIHCRVFTITLNPEERVLRQTSPAIYTSEGINIVIQPLTHRCVVLCIRSRSTSPEFVLRRVRDLLSLEHDIIDVKSRENQLPEEAIYSANYVDPRKILITQRREIYFCGSYTKNLYPVDSGEGAARSAKIAVTDLAGEYGLARPAPHARAVRDMPRM
jgi:predicted NAD/FAD-binding protein